MTNKCELGLTYFDEVIENGDLRKIYIEPTSNCNLACKMCSRNTWFDEEFGDIDLELYKKIINEINETNSIETIFFGGIAEPFANTNLLLMVKMAAETGKKVELISNGMYLDEEIMTEMLKLNIDTLWVSLDGASAESYEEIRTGASYNKVVDNLKLFYRLKLKLGAKSKLGITFVAMKSNVHQIPLLIKLANLLHASELKITNVIPFDKSMTAEVLYSKSVINQDMAEELFEKRNKYYPIINIPVMDYTIPQVMEVMGDIFRYSNLLRIGENNIVRKSRQCKFINDDSLFIRWDGEVSPCMALLHNNITYLSDTERRIEHCSFGNVNESKIADIWNSKDYVDFRNRVRKFDFSPCTICGHCSYAEENQEDCFGNSFPTCGGCLWAEGFARCP